MECGALFIIDDVLANQIMEQEEAYTYYQVLHEESFYEHLLDMTEIMLRVETTDRNTQIAVLRSWQEISDTLCEGTVNQTVLEKLFAVQCGQKEGYLLPQTSYTNIENMLKKAITGQNYVMLYC